LNRGWRIYNVVGSVKDFLNTPHPRVAHTSRRFLSGCMRPNWAYNHRWTARKAEEKLNDLYNNLVKRGLVKEPGDWPWSSWRYYFLQRASLQAMDRVP